MTAQRDQTYWGLLQLGGLNYRIDLPRRSQPPRSQQARPQLPSRMRPILTTFHTAAILMSLQRSSTSPARANHLKHSEDSSASTARMTADMQ